VPERPRILQGFWLPSRQKGVTDRNSGSAIPEL
jgi:hypothetical protein